MENGTKWNEYMGKKLKVLYNDKASTYPRSREGILTAVQDGLLFIKQPSPYPEVAIAISTVVRIEVL